MTQFKRTAFTLIEVIMASVILLLGFLSVASVFSNSYRGSTNSLNHTLAVQVAQNVLAQVQTLPYGSFIPENVATPVTLPGVVEGVPTQVTFTPTVYIPTLLVFTTNGGGEPASVTVTWREGTGPGSTGEAKSYTLVGGISREP